MLSESQQRLTIDGFVPPEATRECIDDRTPTDSNWNCWPWVEPRIRKRVSSCYNHIGFFLSFDNLLVTYERVANNNLSDGTNWS